MKYSTMDKQIFHALAIADGQNRSSTSDGFIERFGQNLFYSEASLTLPPLDSLLSPSGCIAKSQELFAKTFGARRARFATNGTSGANAILWKFLFNRNDLVLVDKNCHISHHYAAANQGVTPIYLEPELIVEPDIYASASIKEIQRVLTELANEKLLERVKGIVLTNCSFDGYILDPAEYITKIDSLLRKSTGDEHARRFVYYFDEAWFSFARFDPGLIRFTAMYAANNVTLASNDRPRVYAAQSVHKTLTALRQSSIILENDHPEISSKPSGLDDPTFQQCFLSCTTTSPSAPIVASFDIARRQMALEGAAMISESVKAVKEFKTALGGNSWPDVSEFFSCSYAYKSTAAVSVMSDPTKLSIIHQLPVAHSQAKRVLWDIGKIQINKFGVNSFMFMFMPGFGASRVRNLLDRLKIVAKNQNSVTTSTATNSSPEILIKECLNQDFEVKSYPLDIARSGRWAMAEIVYGDNTLSQNSIGSHELDDSQKYVCCTFITPYPPGFPILFPGQVVSGETLRQVLNIKSEVHGISSDSKILVAKLDLV